MSINPEKDIDYFLAVFSTTEETLPINTSDTIEVETVTESELIPIPYSEEDEEDEEDEGGGS